MKGFMEETIRILMVEDMLSDAYFAEREINKTLKSCIFQRVETREDYLKAIHDFQPDLIISDYRMPLFDGLAALKLALEHAPMIPVIILTGAINEDTAVECMKAGATDYVIKEHIKRLGQAVIHALEEKQLRQERRQAEENLRRNEEFNRTLVHTLPDAVTVTDLDGNIVYVSPATLNFYGYEPGDDVIGMSIYDWVHADYRQMALETMKTITDGGIIRNQVYPLSKKDGSFFYCEISASCLKDSLGNATGMIIIARDISERKKAENALRISEARYRARTEEFEALFSLSSQLRVARTPQDMLPIVLSEMKTVVPSDASAILQYNEQANLFYISCVDGSIGMTTGTTIRADYRIIGQILRERKVFICEDYGNESKWVNNPDHAKGIGPAIFIPLQSEETLIGIILATRYKTPSVRPFSPGERHLLTALSEIAGNALRRAMLFDEVQTHLLHISQAYDATIEGWSRALDLRDKETEGHTLRVIDLTMKLAEAVGINNAELVHVRRGALLHDIGKMGVPDAILLKPAQLTDEEWAIMRCHPQYAYDMLNPIEYLRPALDIPGFFRHPASTTNRNVNRITQRY